MREDNFREVVERIKNSVSIVDIIGNYVQLKRTGKAYRGLCPFHAEKTPSFYVDPDKGLYHCFGCGASGNVFTFLMKKEGYSFNEAVKELAKVAGIELAVEVKISKELLLLKEAQIFFQKALNESQEGSIARSYLKERKVTAEAISTFGLGYASGAGLVSYLRNKGFDVYTMLKVGLLKESARGGYVEFFQNRLIFPVFDHVGNVVAFGGRALSSSDEPKYINTSETEYFKKGKILYGYFTNRKGIKESGYPIVVEGYFDVLALFMMGIKAGVAPMGTSLTEDQVAFLSTKFQRVVLMFDNDEAGRKAAVRSIKILLEKGILPHVAILEEVKDPAQAWESGNTDFVKQALENSLDFAHYINYISSSFEERAGNVRELLESIEKGKDPILKKEFSDIVAKAFGISSISLGELLKILGGSKTERDIATVDFSLAVAALLDERVRVVLLDELDEKDFVSEDARFIFVSLRDGKLPEEILAEHPNSAKIVEYAMNFLGDINEEVRSDIIERIGRLKASKLRQEIIKKRFENKENVEKMLVEFFKKKRDSMRG